MSYNSIEIKQGATLSLGGYIELPTDTYLVSSNMRDKNGNLVATLTTTITNPVSPSKRYFVTLKATPVQTATWPIGTIYCDVKFAGATVGTMISQTFNIIVLETQTHA